MPTTPAARPSSPSMRFTALAMRATQITVRSGDRSGERTTNPAKGIRKNSSVTPRSDSRLPEKTCPASLAGGDTSRRSSRAPTANITVAPMSSPSGSDVPRKTGRNLGSTEATAMAARKPPYMAAPPRVGVGRSWTRRLSGETTAPRRMATRRTVGVRSQVTTAATARTIRYSAMPAVQDRASRGTPGVIGRSACGGGLRHGRRPPGGPGQPGHRQQAPTQQPGELAGRHRAGEQVALPQRAAHAAEHLELLDGLDALGHGGHAQRPGQLDHGGHHGPVGGRGGEPGHERPVDLD